MGRKPMGDHPMTPAERQRRRRQAPNRIVLADGAAWRLSAARYARLEAAIRAGKEYDLDALGTFLGVTINARCDELERIRVTIG